MADQDLTSADWDKFAKNFANTVEKGPGIPPAEAMLSDLDAILPFSRATTILDIGCGPGQVTNVLVKRYGDALSKDATIIAADNSPAMLEQIEKRKTYMLAKDASSPWQKVQSQLNDVQEMTTIPDSSISHITAGFVLFFAPRQQDTMKELQRVLTPGGLVALSSWKGSDWMDMVEFLKVVKPDLTVPKMTADWMSTEGIQGILERFGFQNVNAHYTETSWEYETPESIAQVVLSFPFVQQVTKTWTTSQVDEFKALGVAFLTEKYGSGHGVMKGTAIVGLGSKGAVAAV